MNFVLEVEPVEETEPAAVSVKIINGDACFLLDGHIVCYVNSDGYLCRGHFSDKVRGLKAHKDGRIKVGGE